MVKLDAGEIPQDIIQNAERLLHRPPVRVSDDYGSHQFNVFHTPARFGKKTVLISESGSGEEVATEAYRSDVELTFDRNNHLRSASARELVEPTAYRSIGYVLLEDLIDKTSTWFKETFVPSHRQAEKERVKRKVARFVAKALDASK